MKIERIFCPSCGGTINGDLANKENIFCPYCGQQLYIDREKNEITINKNININSKIENRIINDADIIRAKKEGNENKYSFLILLITLITILILTFSM